MASLFVIRGKNAGQHFSLRSLRTILGRDASCEIQIVDHEVSRQHAEILHEPDGFVLLDLASSNGSFLNGQRVVKQSIRSGDRLQLGRTLLVFNGEAKSDPSSATKSHQALSIDIVGVIPDASKLASGSLFLSSDSDLSQIRHVLPADGRESKATDVSVLAAAKEPELPGNTVSIIRDKSHWEVMYQTVLAVSRTLDIDQLLTQILDLIFQWVHCDRGCIMLMDETNDQLRPAARRYRENDKATSRIEISQTILDYVIRNREGVLTSNACEDARWSATASIADAGIREAICVPMQGRYGIVGVIHIDTARSLIEQAADSATPLFDEEHLKLMVAIGHQAALAVEDTFYYRGMLQAERLAVMGQTIANLSHHVKNILQGLHGGSYLVAEGLKREQLDTIAKGWRIVEKNQERIASMVMDMLTYSKERQPSLAATDLRVSIDDCVELCLSRAKDFDVELRWSRPETFPSILADSEAMHRAILNVIHNAIDAVSEIPDGRVDVTLDCDSDFVRIEIRDNGVGIPAEDIQRIFSVFESSKGTRGTGLGLPVSQKILREHGGEIEVLSQLGQGSCFRLRLPNRTPSTEIPPLHQQPTLF